MSHRSLTTALTLYHSGAFTLEQAATHSSLSMAKLSSELRSRGLSVREEDRDVLAESATM